jgi:hypothetical protein
MREWIGYFVSLALYPLSLVDELRDRRKYAAWKAAQRAEQIDRASGL